VTVQLNCPPEVVERLTEEARRKGLSLDAYVLGTVLEQETPNGAALSDEAARRQARQEAGRSIRELRKGNILGPDLTIRDRSFLDLTSMFIRLHKKCYPI
jgi:hypothetical protein